MRMFDVQGIEIRASRAKVFEFLSHPGNLPRWAHAFKSADDTRPFSGDCRRQVVRGELRWRVRFIRRQTRVSSNAGQIRAGRGWRGTLVHTHLAGRSAASQSQLCPAASTNILIIRRGDACNGTTPNGHVSEDAIEVDWRAI